MVAELRIIGVSGIPEIPEGADLVSVIIQSCQNQGTPIEESDVLVITQKIISKSEGRIVPLADVTPSVFARQIAEEHERDPRHIEVVLQESRRVVRMDRGVFITETHHGFICANAGVDASNVGGIDLLSLLPIDSDVSAQGIRNGIHEHLGLNVAVIISDTFNRPWRMGTIDVAIGLSGINPLKDYRGVVDPDGYELRSTVTSLADELASAAEVVMGKTSQIPVAIIRGLTYEQDNDNVGNLLRDPSQDLFR